MMLDGPDDIDENVHAVTPVMSRWIVFEVILLLEAWASTCTCMCTFLFKLVIFRGSPMDDMVMAEADAVCWAVWVVEAGFETLKLSSSYDSQAKGPRVNDNGTLSSPGSMD